MKRPIIILLTVSFFAACGGSGSKDKAGATTTGDASQNPDYQNGLELVVKYKCQTCHAIDETITGPPYREVAKKYKDSPASIVPDLAKKIISGGNGVWGEVFMTPHPDVSQADAETMVKYILLLKK